MILALRPRWKQNDRDPAFLRACRRDRAGTAKAGAPGCGVHPQGVSSHGQMVATREGRRDTSGHDAENHRRRRGVRPSSRVDGSHSGRQCRETFAARVRSSPDHPSPHDRASGAALHWRRLLCLISQPDVLLDPLHGVRGRFRRTGLDPNLRTLSSLDRLDHHILDTSPALPTAVQAARVPDTSPALPTTVQAVSLIESGTLGGLQLQVLNAR